jgi:putative SOS response-associated peptidase YedK
MANATGGMPVILGDNDHAEWLDPAAKDLAGLLTPCPADELTCYAVIPYVNKVHNKGPKCIEPFRSG